KLARFLVRKLLWRIRTKLIVSSLFIAVVPVVLLTLFFLLAGVLFTGLVASHLLTTEIERQQRDLEAIARAAVSHAPLGESALAERMKAAQARHPGLSWVAVDGTRTVSAQGDLPVKPPAWLKEDDFAGVVKLPGDDHLRAMSRRGNAFVMVDLPVDEHLVADLTGRTGIKLLRAHTTVQSRSSGITIDVKDDEAGQGKESIQAEGLLFVAEMPELDWETGEKGSLTRALEYQPLALIQRLSAGTSITGALLVKIWAVVGAVFAVMYCVALALGLLLARSITRSVHALSHGTERLRQGDFGYQIKVRSRDQLGELAESFNVMARGIDDLLRESAEKERLEEELRIARQIQMSLLPQGRVGVDGLRVAALCLPAAEVGGDYYDLLPLSDTRLGVVVADVSGKGTSAALYMAELKGLVLSLSRIYDSPGTLLKQANRILSANLDSRSFITMTYAVLDTRLRTMRFARAGHNPLIQLEAASGRTRVLAPQGLGLGIDPGDRFDDILEETEVPLVAGDHFLFFTDGLSEAMNTSAELFGEQRLRDLLEGAPELASEPLKARILAEVRAFAAGTAQHDDMTMVLLQVGPA
ncbi:MAG TPA: SpoIIE family protein phosphatase, partial [Vicinamibacteria bacterium]|nr:SpoIIE family protein phosphatase [Vicinamibacteria bacterium]